MRVLYNTSLRFGAFISCTLAACWVGGIHWIPGSAPTVVVSHACPNDLVGRLREDIARLHAIEDDAEFLREVQEYLGAELGCALPLAFGGRALLPKGGAYVPLDDLHPDHMVVVDGNGQSEVIAAAQGMWVWRGETPRLPPVAVPVDWSQEDVLLLKEQDVLFMYYPSDGVWVRYPSTAPRDEGAANAG